MKRAEYLEAPRKRRQEIVKLAKRKPPLSNREIGLRVTPQITSQRVGQILAREGVSRR